MTGETSAFRFVGENLALDFVNTRTTEGGAVTEALPSFDAAVAWLTAAGVLRAADARVLLRGRNSREAADALHALHAFRDVLRAMLDDHHEHGAIAPRYLKAVNERLQACACARALVREGDRYAMRVHYRFERPGDLLMPVANAAAELVAQADLTRVKRCGSGCCDMYFLDTSRNRSRTWCDMAACGNRAKAAAYYRRTKSAAHAAYAVTNA